MKILSLQSSVNGDTSITRSLSTTYIECQKIAHPGATVVEHDLANQNFPHMRSELVSVTLGLGHVPSAAADLSEQLIVELEQCDVVVLGAPMYNFGMPSTIKAWFDYVMRVGRTFRYVDGAPQGLLPSGKKAIVFVASGGIYSEGPGQAMDFLEPHMRWLLRFIGITDVTFVRAEGLVYGPDAAQAATTDAHEKARALVGK